MKLIHPMAKRTFLYLASLCITGLTLLGCVLFYMELQLPNVDTLKDIRLQVPLRIYTSDGKLIAQYGEKRRIPITTDQAPKQLIQAILATEDARFYTHPGVDFIGLVRATKALILTGKKTQGASTITMQVARNFFLTKKKTYRRKLNEILLAIKIDQELSKEKILELYLNKIYLGQRAYGVAAAAQVYYGKTLDQLDLAQLAMIAGLPQAPSRDNPIRNIKDALKRRNHVLSRLLEVGYIDEATYKQAIQELPSARYHGPNISISAPYVAEMTRLAMIDRFGDNAYTAGLKVYTTIDSNKQVMANKALRDGLIAYDHRHGYRGPESRLGQPAIQDDQNIWLQQLKKIPIINGLQPAVVTDVSDRSATALLRDGSVIEIPWQGLAWARPQLSDDHLGRTPKTANDILHVGDVIRVEQNEHNQWVLVQIPEVEGALIALDPNTGAILALVGGFTTQDSSFNRAIQAERQPGSSFKPFIYSAALAKGYTLASMINDAPVVMGDWGENLLWRPKNSTLRFYGPTRLKIGLIKSRNLVSIRLLQAIGVPYVLNFAQRFGFDSRRLPHTLSLALGTAALTPLELANGYAVFANGGKKVTAYTISRIEDESNQTLFQAPVITNNAEQEQAITPQNAYLITSALQDAIRHGTAQSALVLKRSDLAGKTGTTNDQKDAWFAGYNSQLVCVTWLGFDSPQSLHEYGAQAALPVWIDFMRQVLDNTPEYPEKQPPGLVTVRIDPKTGRLAYPGQPNAIFEIFRKHYVPKNMSIDTSTNSDTTTADDPTMQLF